MIGDVLDTLDGLFRLTRRSATLDGAVPVRVARGCVPLLEGNAYGLQLTLTRPLIARRRLGRWTAVWEDGDGDAGRRQRGAVPRLVEEGFLARGGPWERALRGSLVRAIPGGLRLVTGLLVRPAANVWLRVTSTANRRNTLFDVVAQVVPDDDAWVPLVLDLRLSPDAPATLRLHGEVACLGALRAGVRVTSLPIAEAPELARAHAAFYDRGYFEDKRDDVTGKYRRLVASETTAADPTAACRVAVIGASRHAIVPLGAFTTSDGPRPRERDDARRVETIVFRNEIAFQALYDGQNVTIDHDAEALAARTRGVADALTRALGASETHPGARLYLTKYFTPHVPGEPHFFVKPWALTATPAGWSCLVEGIHGRGYDVWRGVVSTDAFHATPAVFRIHGDGTRIRVAADAALLRVIPIPRALLGHEHRLQTLS